MSVEKKHAIEVDVETHLGTVSGLLSNGTIDENEIEKLGRNTFRVQC